MEENKYCWWKNLCDKHYGEYRCCHFCEDNKRCDHPCFDDLSKCNYRCDIPGDQAFKRMREKEIKDYYDRRNAKLKVNAITSDLHKISEVAKAIGKNYDFIYNKVKSGEIQGVLHEGKYYINEKEFKRILTVYKGE